MDAGRRRRRLDRRNAAKHFEYPSPLPTPSASPAATPLGSSFEFSPSPPVNSEVACFRISGAGSEEIEMLCRSLGLDGPDDFAVPVDAWESRKARLRESASAPEPQLASVLGEISVQPASPLPEATATATTPRRSGNEGGINGVRPPPLTAVNGVDTAWIAARIEDGVGAMGAEAPMSTSGDPSPKWDSTSATDDDEGSRRLNLGEMSGEFTGMSSLSTTNDDETSSTTTDMILVTPMGQFKKKFQYWDRGRLLGKGSFGEVYEAITDEGSFYAVKEVCLIDQGSHAQQCIRQLEQEILLLSRFEHRNIVQYYGTDKRESKLFIFLELVTKGSLANLYQRYNLRDSHVSAYTRQILSGLSYLHDRDVVHRDIKCANILVHADGSVKLADFGLAKEIKRLNEWNSCKGSVFWMAPEVVNHKRACGLPADIWSLGCTVLEMLTRQVPYPNMDWTQAFWRIGRGEPPQIPSSLSRDARDFIRQCVKVNPEDRPTAVQLLNHPFINRPSGSSSASNPSTPSTVRM